LDETIFPFFDRNKLSYERFYNEKEKEEVNI